MVKDTVLPFASCSKPSLDIMQSSFFRPRHRCFSSAGPQAPGGCRAVIPRPAAGAGGGRPKEQPPGTETGRGGAEPPGAGRHGAQSEEPAAEQTPSAETGHLIIAGNKGY
jgi:hypothetical protein